jgi:hypothetical protein
VSIAIRSYPEILDQLRRDLALSGEELAAILGLPSPALLQGPAAGHPLPASAVRRLEQLIVLNDRLRDSFQPEGITVWLRTGSRYLHGESPIAALTNGRFDRVTTALDALDAGIFL